MATATMLSAFASLPSRAARKAAVDQLVQHLDRYELRELQMVLGVQSFKLDVVSHLPLELVALVFKHLDPAAPFRLQQISKQWRTLLRSPVVVQSNLLAYTGDARSLCNASYDTLLQKAQAIQAFRTAKITRLLTIGHDIAASDQVTARRQGPMLVQHYVIGIRERVLLIYDIWTEETHRVYGEAREYLECFAVSDEIVAFASSQGFCYVVSLDLQERCRFRLPSAWLSILVCQGRTVICGGNLKGGAHIYRYCLDSNSGQSFEISFQDAPFDVLLLPDTYTPIEPNFRLIPDLRSQSVLVVAVGPVSDVQSHTHQAHEPGPPPHPHGPTAHLQGSRSDAHDDPTYVKSTVGSCLVSYARYDMDGSLLQHGVYELENSANFFVEDVSITPVDSEGGYAVKVIISRSSAYETRELFLSASEFTIQKSPYSRFVDEPQLDFDPLGKVGETAWWKDTLYGVRFSSQSSPSWASAPVGCTLVAKPGGKERWQSVFQLESSRLLTKLLINDQYLVAMDYAGVQNNTMNIFWFSEWSEETDSMVSGDSVEMTDFEEM